MENSETPSFLKFPSYCPKFSRVSKKFFQVSKLSIIFHCFSKFPSFFHRVAQSLSGSIKAFFPVSFPQFPKVFQCFPKCSSIFQHMSEMLWFTLTCTKWGFLMIRVKMNNTVWCRPNPNFKWSYVQIQARS